MFALWSHAFSLAVVVVTPTPVIASQTIPLLIPVLYTVNGVFVPHIQLPAIWKAAFWANPVSYYMRGQVATLLHARKITCSSSELFRFNPPPGQTCGFYAGNWTTAKGGALLNPSATSLCEYCPYTTGDVYLAQNTIPFNFRWKAFGIMLCFTAVTTFMCYLTYWLTRLSGFSFSTTTRSVRSQLARMSLILRP